MGESVNNSDAESGGHADVRPLILGSGPSYIFFCLETWVVTPRIGRIMGVFCHRMEC